MKIEVLQEASARQIAELHKRIAELKLAVRALRDPIDGPPIRYGIALGLPLKASTRNALWRLDKDLHSALLDLESPFLRATHDRKSPFHEPNEPNAWHEWLDARETAAADCRVPLEWGYALSKL